MARPKTLRQKVKTLVNALQAKCPTLWPVHLDYTSRTVKELKCYGMTDFKKKPKPYFKIDIASDMVWPMMKDTLIHEWAHAVCWDGGGFSDHSALWGVAFARCYRIMHRER